MSGDVANVTHRERLGIGEPAQEPVRREHTARTELVERMERSCSIDGDKDEARIVDREGDGSGLPEIDLRGSASPQLGEGALLRATYRDGSNHEAGRVDRCLGLAPPLQRVWLLRYRIRQLVIHLLHEHQGNDGGSIGQRLKATRPLEANYDLRIEEVAHAILSRALLTPGCVSKRRATG